jgi:type IV secretion system protein VirD4
VQPEEHVDDWRADPGRGGPGYPGPRYGRFRWAGTEDWLYGIAAPLAAVVVAAVLVAGHVSALAFAGSWPHYGLADVPRLLAGVVGHPDDPGRAWEQVDPTAGAPGPVAWWGTLAVTAAAVGLLGWRLWPAIRRAGDRAAGREVGVGSDGGWGGRGAERTLRLRAGEQGRLVVGTSGRHQLAVHGLESLLVVGPAHSGKTSGLAIPALLEWRGPAVVAASKGHLIDDTIGWRARQGDARVFDPAAVTRHRASGWSPLADCATWAGAIRTAQDLTSGATAAVGTTADRDDLTGTGRGYLWRSSMAMALAPFLFAAATSGRTIVDLAEWVEREDHEEVLAVLRSVDRSVADAHEAAFLHPDEGRSSFLQVMHRILSVYKDPTVAASTERHEIVPADLLDGGNGTLYLTAPEHDQARFRPLGATIVRQVMAAAYERSSVEGGPLDPPLLLVLDQVVGIAPVDDLGALASSAAARGVQVVSIFQDVAQIQDHYGAAAAPLVKNHRAKLVLPSGHDVDPTVQRARLLTPGLAEQLADGEGALLYGNLPPVRVRLRPWFRDRELRERAEAESRGAEPTESQVADAPYLVDDRSALWFRSLRSARRRR